MAGSCEHGNASLGFIRKRNSFSNIVAAAFQRWILLHAGTRYCWFLSYEIDSMGATMKCSTHDTSLGLYDDTGVSFKFKSVKILCLRPVDCGQKTHIPQKQSHALWKEHVETGSVIASVKRCTKYGVRYYGAGKVCCRERMRSAEGNVKGKNREKRGSTVLDGLRDPQKSEKTFKIRTEQKRNILL